MHSLSLPLLSNAMKNNGIFLVSLLFVLGVMATIVLSVIVLTIFMGTEVERRQHIILILADDLGTSLIHKCNVNWKKLKYFQPQDTMMFLGTMMRFSHPIWTSLPKKE